MSQPAPQRPVRDWERLARAAAVRAEAEGASRVARQRLLAFRLAESPYALPVEVVREIVRIRPVTPVPRMPADVLGVISLRGGIVQVIDTRRRLGLDPVEPSRHSRIVVVHGGDERVAGLLVDAVTEVFSADESDLRATSGDALAVQALVARGESFVSLVDLERVLGIHAEC